MRVHLGTDTACLPITWGLWLPQASIDDPARRTGGGPTRMSVEPDWERVTGLFDELIDFTAGERERVLSSMTTTDAAIVREVRSLLVAHDAADGRLDRPLLVRLSSSSVEALLPVDPL